MDDGHLSNITSQNCGRNKKARRKEKNQKSKILVLLEPQLELDQAFDL
jgi:hypothetical protein